MNVRAVTLSSLLLCGFTCTPRPPDPVSLKEAERWEKAGKLREAVLEYGRILTAIQSRTDLHSDLAYAKIYSRFFALNLPAMVQSDSTLSEPLSFLEPYWLDRSGKSFLALGMEADLRILASPTSAEVRAESADRIVSSMCLKIDRSELRTAELEDAQLQTLILLEITAAFEYLNQRLKAASSGERLSQIYADLGQGYRELIKRDRLLPFAKEQWNELSDAYMDRAMMASHEGPLPEPPEEYAKWAEYSLERHLQEGDRESNSAIGFKVRGDLREAERCYRAALRHSIFVRESLAQRNTAQEIALRSIPLILRSWASLCFAE
jgi:hypothetical protein